MNAFVNPKDENTNSRQQYTSPKVNLTENRMMVCVESVTRIHKTITVTFHKLSFMCLFVSVRPAKK